MKEYIYPTRANQNDEWAKDMLNAWRQSKQPFLCFPWIRWHVHTLPDEPFWMYLYYSWRESDIPELMGKIEFRVRVIDWNPSRFHRDQLYQARYNEDGKVWFLCDIYEEIRDIHHQLLNLDDFKHALGKNLVSAMRKSIPSVICQTKLLTINRYPGNS